MAALGGALVAAPLVPSQTRPPESRRPNIIFIHADDLGYGDLSCYGQQRFRTPNIDRMAAEGTKFTNYYAGSPVCAPSRAVLMTGLHTGHAYIRGNSPNEPPLRPEDVTVAEVLKTAGYTTAVIGKWGLGQAGTTGLPNRQGFDESFGYLDHKHAHRQYTNYLWKNGEVFWVNQERDYANDLFAQAALDFIARNKTRPFFLYLAFTIPHAELRVPEDSLKEFRGRFPETPFVNARADQVAAAEPGLRPSLGYRSQPAPHAAFAAMVTRMDRYVGQVLARLKELGLDRDTVVFFTSDNGPHKEGGGDPAFFNSAGPLRGIKRDLYEGGIRVPMIVRWPGKVKAGRTSDQVWAHWDFLPTAAEIAGAKVASQTGTGAGAHALDGLSMLPALLGQPQKNHEFLYWEFFERGFEQAVRMGDWKAVRHRLDQPLELYDLKTDIGEQHNIAADHPEIVARIEAYLKTARTDSALWPIKERKQTSSTGK
jgi:arylsulfatase A-like enzyme